MNKLSLFILLLAVVSFVNCKKSSPLTCTAFALEISDEVNAFSTAATNFSNDPSPENCAAYKMAGQQYLNALKGYDSCAFTGQERDSYNASIKEAEESLQDLMC
jgi:hypothetical protein